MGRTGQRMVRKWRLTAGWNHVPRLPMQISVKSVGWSAPLKENKAKRLRLLLWRLSSSKKNTLTIIFTKQYSTLRINVTSADCAKSKCPDVGARTTSLLARSKRHRSSHFGRDRDRILPAKHIFGLENQRTYMRKVSLAPMNEPSTAI